MFFEATVPVTPTQHPAGLNCTVSFRRVWTIGLYGFFAIFRRSCVWLGAFGELGRDSSILSPQAGMTKPLNSGR